jgi:nucleotide-binding universal stress UspA family protein
MRRILVAIDGSDASQKATRMAADIAQRFGARLTVLYVVPRILLPPDVYGLTVVDVEREQRSYGEKLVSEALSKLGEPGVNVDTQILSGPPAESIAEAAQAADIDLVVVGSRGRGAAARVLLGSTSTRLVHICPKPILVVH